MKILVTSGGTKIPIDMVRDITNMSTGTFGSKIALELLKLNHDVIFLTAKKGRTPFKLEINLAIGYNRENIETWASSNLKVIEEMKEKFDLLKHYQEIEYHTFAEYQEQLESIVKIHRPDIVVLAAAVSDYGVENPIKGKLRSDDMLQIKLTKLPKLIECVKKWYPETKLVGFKLLVGSKNHQLVDAAKKSIVDNQCDMVVANDLTDIKGNKHKVHLVFPTGDPITYNADLDDSNYLARMVAQHTVNL